MKKQVLLLIVFIILLSGLILFTNKNKQPKKQSSPERISPTVTGTVQFALNINTPTDGEIVRNRNIQVSGVTAPGAEVYINDISVAADDKGNFGTKITLDEGENNIVVIANDDTGNFTEQEMTVTYQP